MGLKKWFRRAPSAADMSEELQSHLSLRAEHDGVDETAARRRFGNTLQTQEEMRGVWIARFWDTLAQDTHFTWRSWQRNPGFVLAAVLVLAMGLGSSAALFSVLDRILFRSLPYPDANRLVSVGLVFGGSTNESMPAPAYLEIWRPAPGPFESVTSISSAGAPCDLTDQQPERLRCARVEANLLRVLGRSVVAGRDFTAEDDVPGAPRVALIRHGFWVQRFGADSNVIGRTLNLDGQSVAIAGVLPPDFELPIGTGDVLLPQQLEPPSGPRAFTRFIQVFARLKPGVAPQAAESALEPMLARHTQTLPPVFRVGAKWLVRSVHNRQVGDSPRTAWLLLGSVAALLLIACVNVTNLMLARVAARQREFAVRAALGAGKSRLARLALTESLLLSLGAGGIGLAGAAALLKVFIAMAPASIPKIQQASLDLRVVGVAVALSIVAGAAVGLWPAFSLSRTGTLHGSRTTAVGSRVRFGLVTAQIAVAVMMLGGSALLLRSLWKLTSIPLGFEPDHVLALSVTLNAAQYRTPEQQTTFFEDLLDRASHMPTSVAAALTDSPFPFGQAMRLTNVESEGNGLAARGTAFWRRSVTPRYFEALRIPIVRGRFFLDADRKAPEPVIILAESAERILFPGHSALGQRIKIGPNSPWEVVVGVAGDIRNAGPTAEPEPLIYAIRPPTADRFGSVAVRTNSSTAIGSSFLRRVMADLDPRLPVTIQPLDQQVASLTERPRFVTWLLAAFAGFALLLAATGLYGVAAYLVTQRTRDIGVRIALGATPGRISREVIREAGRWIAAGALLGCALAWGGTRALESQLYGVTKSDPVSWIATLALLAVTLIIAAVRPASRAAHVDPCTSLRVE